MKKMINIIYFDKVDLVPEFDHYVLYSLNKDWYNSLSNYYIKDTTISNENNHLVKIMNLNTDVYNAITTKDENLIRNIFLTVSIFDFNNNENCKEEAIIILLNNFIKLFGNVVSRISRKDELVPFGNEFIELINKLIILQPENETLVLESIVCLLLALDFEVILENEDLNCESNLHFIVLKLSDLVISISSNELTSNSNLLANNLLCKRNFKCNSIIELADMLRKGPLPWNTKEIRYHNQSGLALNCNDQIYGQSDLIDGRSTNKDNSFNWY